MDSSEKVGAAILAFWALCLLASLAAFAVGIWAVIALVLHFTH